MNTSGLPPGGVVTKEDRANIESLQEYAQSLKLQLSAANKQVRQLTEQVERVKKENERLGKTAYLNKRQASVSHGRTDQSGVLEIVPGKNPTLDNTHHGTLPPVHPKENIDSGLLEVARSLKQRYAAVIIHKLLPIHILLFSLFVLELRISRKKIVFYERKLAPKISADMHNPKNCPR